MFSVIVPTMWRAWDTFENQLIKMIDHPKVSEIIIIDNDVRNAKNADLSPIYNSKVKVHSFRENIYVNPAWNFGVSVAKEKYICILNDDLVFDTVVFDLATPEILDHNGIIGLDHHTKTDTPCITPIDKHCWPFGFGCLMLMRKDRYTSIPDNLKVYWGDSFLLLSNACYSKKCGVVCGVCDSPTIGKTTQDLNLSDIVELDNRVWANQILPTLDIS